MVQRLNVSYVLPDPSPFLLIFFEIRHGRVISDHAYPVAVSGSVLVEPWWSGFNHGRKCL